MVDLIIASNSQISAGGGTGFSVQFIRQRSDPWNSSSMADGYLDNGELDDHYKSSSSILAHEGPSPILHPLAATLRAGLHPPLSNTRGMIVQMLSALLSSSNLMPPATPPKSLQLQRS
jgi:hypothetical protein